MATVNQVERNRILQLAQVTEEKYAKFGPLGPTRAWMMSVERSPEELHTMQAQSNEVAFSVDITPSEARKIFMTPDRDWGPGGAVFVTTVKPDGMPFEEIWLMRSAT